MPQNMTGEETVTLDDGSVAAIVAAVPSVSAIQSGLATASALADLDGDMGEPAGASLAADIAAVKARVDLLDRGTPLAGGVQGAALNSGATVYIPIPAGAVAYVAMASNAATGVNDVFKVRAENADGSHWGPWSYETALWAAGFSALGTRPPLPTLLDDGTTAPTRLNVTELSTANAKLWVWFF